MHSMSQGAKHLEIGNQAAVRAGRLTVNMYPCYGTFQVPRLSSTVRLLAPHAVIEDDDAGRTGTVWVLSLMIHFAFTRLRAAAKRKKRSLDIHSQFCQQLLHLLVIY